jgi:hypothetical protein
VQAQASARSNAPLQETTQRRSEHLMDEDRFNLSVRTFLKEVGVTSQREIEKAVRDALTSGRLRGDSQIEATMTLQIPELGLTHIVDGHVDLG